MDKDRLIQIVESVLETSYGDNVCLTEIVILPTQKFDEEKNGWVPDSYSLFLSIKRKNKTDGNETYPTQSINDVEHFLESFLGFECCVDFI